MMKLDTNHEVVLTLDRQQYAHKRGFVGKTKTHKKSETAWEKIPRIFTSDTYNGMQNDNDVNEIHQNM